MTDCPHCEPDHTDPWSRPWGVSVSSERDGDGQPTTLNVMRTDGSHVAESDAQWLWGVIREAQIARARYEAGYDD